MGMDEDSGEQLRKSCDYCARMKRACDGQVPCALCCRRGKACERSVRRKSGPAKGAKYAPRRSKLEKGTAAAADANTSGTAGNTPGAKAKNRGQGMKKRGAGDVRGKGSDDGGGKTSPRSATPRRHKQVKAQEEAENPVDRSLASPPGSPPPAAAVKQQRDSPREAREARAESPPRNEAGEKDPSAREKGIQRSVKKRKSVSSKVPASAPPGPDSPRKKRVPPSGVSSEEAERRAGSNRLENGDVSPPDSSPPGSAERPRAFPGEVDGNESSGPREHATVADEDEQFRRHHHQQQKKHPWQQRAPPAEAPGKHEGDAKPVVRECERSPGARAMEAAPPLSEGREGSWGGKYPVTVSPMREDEGPLGWEEPPPRVRAWEPSMERGDIDAYYRQYSGMGPQSGRVRPPQQDQAVPLAPKELLRMLRPNDKDIIDVVVDDKRAAVKEGAPPLEAASPRGSPNAVAISAPLQVPRVVSSSSSNNGSNGSSDLQAKEQARELLAKIRRDAAAQAKAAHDEELAPKAAAIVSPGARPISGGNGSGNGPTGRDHVEEAMTHEIRRSVGVKLASRGRPQEWRGPEGFCRMLPPLQRDRHVYQGHGRDREHRGSEGSRGYLDMGNGGDGGGGGYNDRLRPTAGPGLGPRDLVEGCLGPEKTEEGMRGRDAGNGGGEGGYWRAPPPRTAPRQLSVPAGRIHVDYRGDRAGYILSPFRENERKQAAMPHPNRGGSWGFSTPQHPGMRMWPPAPIEGPPSLPPPVVSSAPMHSHEPLRPRVPHGDFHPPRGDYRFSGGRGGEGVDGINAGFWKGNTWSLSTLSERRSGSDFVHPRQGRSHPDLSFPGGDRPDVHEAASNHHHGWPVHQAQRDGWRGQSPVRVGPNARSYAS